jgi:hypothetical protein
MQAVNVYASEEEVIVLRTEKTGKRCGLLKIWRVQFTEKNLEKKLSSSTPSQPIIHSGIESRGRRMCE